MPEVTRLGRRRAGPESQPTSLPEPAHSPAGPAPPSLLPTYTKNSAVPAHPQSLQVQADSEILQHPSQQYWLNPHFAG